MIKARYAGSFFPKDKEQCSEIIKKSFLSKHGPGSFPEIVKVPNRCKAVIAPHAGYFYSGACAAHAYKQIAESEARNFIILGVDHHNFGSCITLEDFDTPLGIVENNRSITENMPLPVNDIAHYMEHSIQVQLPFLKFIKPNAKITPIIVSDDCDFEALSSLLFNLLDTNKDLALICSSDFTHYGVDYGYVPFDKNVKEKMYEQDHKAIEIILTKNPKDFNDYLEKTQTTICGRNTLYLLLRTIEKSEYVGTLLKYYTSGDIVGNYNTAVGYAAIMFSLS